MSIWSLLNQHIEFIGGIVVALAAFFAGRYLRKDRVTESLTRKNLLLDLREKMQRQEISGEQLRTIEIDFDKIDRIRKIEDRLTVESYDFGVAEIEEAVCQQDMNRAQARRLEMLDTKLAAVIHELGNYLGNDDKAKLRALQRAWEEYRTEQADWAARPWGDGSMAPFIQAGEASRLTVERLASLESELDTARAAYARGESLVN